MLRHVVARPSVGGCRSGRSGGVVPIHQCATHSSTSDRLFDLCHRGFEEPIVGKGAGPAPSITLPISASRGDPPGRAFGWEELKFQTGRSAVGGVRLLGGRCWCRCAAKPADAVADVGDAVPVSHDRPPNGPASRAAARQPAVLSGQKRRGEPDGRQPGHAPRGDSGGHRRGAGQKPPPRAGRGTTRSGERRPAGRAG